MSASRTLQLDTSAEVHTITGGVLYFYLDPKKLVTTGKGKKLFCITKYELERIMGMMEESAEAYKKEKQELALNVGSGN